MNLVQTSAFIRKLVNIILAALALYVIYLVSAPIIIKAVYVVFPPKDLPNPIYGQLPALEFVEHPISNERYTFSLNTPDGRLPSNFPRSVPVYVYKKQPFSYEAGKNAQRHAETLGFTDSDLITDLKGTIYRWRSLSTGGVLEIDIDSKKLTLTTPLLGKASLFTTGNINEAVSMTQARQMLMSIGRLDDTLYSGGTQVVSLGRLSGDQLTAASSPFEAQVARVDFFRKINDYPVLGPNPKKGLINVTLKAQDNQNKALNYPYIEVYEWELVPTTEQTRATYPIIPVADAWNAVSKENKGVIANIEPIGNSIFNPTVPVRVDQILISKVYLAYYDRQIKQAYMQPIYVFEGQYNVSNRPGGNIVIYFPAVDGNYIKPVENDLP